ncbi:hypothetical protein ACMZOO_05540 [Catenovulum sp. SX2]|uniref:hypothetical protein n=1 Tax=Catenovulum sp. SX2 TaxID=3398614 RepID=UPI003F824182
MFWYFGQNKVLDQVKSLQQQIDQQNQAIEKLLNKVEKAQLNNQAKALPAPQQQLEAKPAAVTSNVVNITKDNSAENHKEISTNKNSKSHFERKEPTIKL